jgi:hypothetical protein
MHAEMLSFYDAAIRARKFLAASLAAELRPDDDATNWNLGIAATALREWRIARAAWRRARIKVEEGDAPIVDGSASTRSG